MKEKKGKNQGFNLEAHLQILSVKRADSLELEEDQMINLHFHKL